MVMNDGWLLLVMGGQGQAKGTPADRYPAMAMATLARDAIVVTFGRVARVHRVLYGDH